jgi:hypothetical protein
MSSCVIIIFYVFTLSFFGKSINININRINNRLRNSSLRYIINNDIFKFCREKTNQLVSFKKVLSFRNSSISLLSHYYNLVYEYYSLEEEDISKLELIFSLIF